jgi:hypothetical protein
LIRKPYEKTIVEERVIGEVIMTRARKIYARAVV